MNEPTALDLTGGWESIVNNAERRNARCRFEEKLAKRKLQKQINRALFYATGAALAILLECTGLLAPWVAVAAALVLVCTACFVAGRIAGNWEVLYGTKECDTQ